MATLIDTHKRISKFDTEKVKNQKIFESNIEDSLIHGYNKKYGFFLKKIVWQKRFFVLKSNGDLYYFAKDTSSKHKKVPVRVKGNRFWKSNMRRHCVHIERASKPFFVVFDTYEEYVKWVRAFTESGGISTPPQVVDFLDGQRPTFCSVKVKNWNKDNVLDWLSFVSLTEEESFSKYEKCFESVTNGKQILNITGVALQQMGVDDDHTRLRLLHCIKQMKENNGKFDFDHYVVYHKMIQRMRISSRNGRLKPEMEHHFSKNLSNAIEIKKTYMNDLYQKLINDNENMTASYFVNEEEKEETEGEEEKEKSSSNSNTDVESLNFSEEILKYVEEQQLQRGDKIPIRLLIHETFQNKRHDMMKNFLNPVMKNLPKFSSSTDLAESLRPAILVGDYLLEWNESSILVPKRLCGDAAVSVQTIKPELEVPFDKKSDLEKKISKFVHIWNTTKYYSPSKKPMIDETEEEEQSSMMMGYDPVVEYDDDEEEEDGKGLPDGSVYSMWSDCSQFVREGLKFFGAYSSIKENSRYSLLQKMHENGGEIKGLTFIPPGGFRIKFSEAMGRKKQIVFETHQEFDKFIQACRSIDELSLEMEFKSEMALLRDFDRILWIRYRAGGMQNHQKYGPLKDEETGVVNCFFGDIGQKSSQKKD